MQNHATTQPFLGQLEQANARKTVEGTKLRVHPLTLPSEGQWAALGGLRFVLALVVVIVHLVTAQGLGPDSMLWHVKQISGLAVVLIFFVISGFSIANATENQTSSKQFYTRRFWRIAPTYYLCLAISILAWLVLGLPPSGLDMPYTGLSVAAAIVFGQTVIAHPLFYFGPSWSLSCEVTYYAFAPLLKRLSTFTLTAVLVLSIAFYLATRTPDQPQMQLFGISTIKLFWAWIGGFVFYRVHQQPLAWLILVIAVPMLISLEPSQVTLYRVYAAAIFTAIVALSCKAQFPDLILKLLHYLGELSYPLYLVHFMVIRMAIHTESAILIVLCVASAALLVHLVERPIASLRRRNRSNVSPTLPVSIFAVTEADRTL